MSRLSTKQRRARGQGRERARWVPPPIAFWVEHRRGEGGYLLPPGITPEMLGLDAEAGKGDTP